LLRLDNPKKTTSESRIQQCVVFDLFHTLVDDDEFRPKSFRRTERIASLLQVDPVAFSSYWTNTLTIRNTRSNPIVTLVEDYLSKLGKTCSPKLLSQIDYELGRYQDMAILNPRPEIINVLKSLTKNGFRLGLLSNCDKREARQWQRSPISSFFETVCFSYAIGCQKPDREAYQMVLEKLDASPSQTAFVGDGGSNELDGARAAGFGLVVFMKGFVSRNGLHTAAELELFQRSADASIDNLRDLPNVLNRHLA
jgi:putative hydrolase of the HAD superfamily